MFPLVTVLIVTLKFDVTDAECVPEPAARHNCPQTGHGRADARDV